MYANTHQRRRYQRVLVGENNKLVYRGENFGGRKSHRGQLSKVLVGVYDKEAGALRLVEAGQVFQLEQFVKGVDDVDDTTTAANLFAGADQRDVKNALTTSFGSKRAKIWSYHSVAEEGEREEAPTSVTVILVVSTDCL
eukprot:g5054.t1